MTPLEIACMSNANSKLIQHLLQKGGNEQKQHSAVPGCEGGQHWNTSHSAQRGRRNGCQR